MSLNAQVLSFPPYMQSMCSCAMTLASVREKGIGEYYFRTRENQGTVWLQWVWSYCWNRYLL